ncbi:MAG TPA: thioesterase family protein [Acidimicrobiales bacterium]|nr:thioesterase family protein [Acidimicrobiales bacterium]
MDLDDSWSIGGFMNGGYLLATMCLAGSTATSRPEPLAVTATYLSPPVGGPAEISVEVAKKGRQSTVAEIVLHQDGLQHVRATVILGDLDDYRGPNLEFPTPSIPHLEQCVPIGDGPGPNGIALPEIFQHFDVRLAPGLGWLNGERPRPSSDRAARIDGWTRFTDGREPDPTSLMLFADAFPPAVLDLFPASWVPTLQYSVYVRARPQPGWLQGTFRTRSMVGGLLEEDGELFDSSGRLVALSRQLALLRPPA